MRISDWSSDVCSSDFQAHFATQYVDQLRQLIETGLAQPVADTGEPWVAAPCLLDDTGGLHVWHHGAELQHFDDRVVEAVPLLTEQHGSWAVEPHQNGDRQHKRGKEHEQTPCKKPVTGCRGSVAQARQRPPCRRGDALAGY